MRPLIGITADFEQETGRLRLNAAYVRAVEAAGGLAVVLGGDSASVPGVLSRLDGVVLSGGGDIDPLRFGESAHPQIGRIEPVRDAYEIALAQLAHERGVPLLGICRGCQVMAVAGGEGLYQDIPSQAPSDIRHVQPEARSETTHTVRIRAGTRLQAITGREVIEVNSFHHQSVRAVPAGCRQAGEAPDGIIEAFEDPAHPFWVAVQWHPEELARDSEVAQALFAALVQAAREAGAHVG